MFPNIEFGATFWILLSGVVVLSTFISFVAVFRLKTEIEKREERKKSKATISYQRERIENKGYELTKDLHESQERFLDSNGLLLTISSDIHRGSHVRDDSFFNELGIDCHEIKVEDHLITCLMPFNNSFKREFEVIKTVCRNNGFECRRSDDIFVSGNILKHTVELILKSELLIAVLDGRNPNVTYEIGIAHAIGKNVILIANLNKMESIPFNLKSNRFVLYKSWTDLDSQLDKVLKSLEQ